MIDARSACSPSTTAAASSAALLFTTCRAGRPVDPDELGAGRDDRDARAAVDPDPARPMDASTLMSAARPAPRASTVAPGMTSSPRGPRSRRAIGTRDDAVGRPGVLDAHDGVGAPRMTGR
jgi:hypothetical protein